LKEQDIEGVGGKRDGRRMKKTEMRHRTNIIEELERDDDWKEGKIRRK
jgi:hypothetical protein